MTDAPGTTTAATTGRDAGPPTRSTGSDVRSGAVAGQSPDTLAWVLAFLPLGTALLHSIANAMGVHPGIVSLAALGGSVALVVMDKRELARTGRLAPSAAPSTLWCLFPPGYLRRRAKLLGEHGGRFWISLACMGLAFAAQIAVLAGGIAEPPSADVPTDAVAPMENVAAASALPGCTDEANMPYVLETFTKLKPMRDADVQGVVLTDRTELAGGESQHPLLRICSGRMQASNEEDYDILYAFEIVEGRVIVHVELR